MRLPNLPEPNHFTLEQICKRWECDEDRLLQYCKSDMLQIGVIFNNAPARQNDNLGKSDSVLNGFYALSSGDVIDTMNWGDSPGYDDGFCCSIKYAYMPNGCKESYFNLCDEEPTVGPEFILKNSHVFCASSLVIEKTERDRFETRHTMYICESIDNEDSTRETLPTLNIQEKRELILKGWLAGKGFKEPLELTQNKTWEALYSIDSQIFRHSAPDTIKQFFKKQTLCSFKLGKRKG